MQQRVSHGIHLNTQSHNGEILNMHSVFCIRSCRLAHHWSLVCRALPSVYPTLQYQERVRKCKSVSLRTDTVKSLLPVHLILANTVKLSLANSCGMRYWKLRTSTVIQPQFFCWSYFSRKSVIPGNPA